MHPLGPALHDVRHPVGFGNVHHSWESDSPGFVKPRSVRLRIVQVFQPHVGNGGDLRKAGRAGTR